VLTRRDILAASATLLAGPAVGQSLNPSALSAFMKDNRYLPLYAQGPDSRLIPFEQLASLVGEEREALKDSPARVDSNAERLSGVRAEDALVRIAREASNRQIVILNEAHNCSRHRAFLGVVLRRLKELGYNYLAAETFLNAPPTPRAEPYHQVTSRFDPLDSIYTRDPVLAESIREAVGAGWRLISYEQHAGQRTPGLSTQESVERREAAQAENLKSALDAIGGDARVVVYVGWGHLRERPTSEGRRMMASRLKEISGIDPLTIEQSQTGSFGPHGRDSPETMSILQQLSPSRPIIAEADGKVVGAAELSADLAVYHPSLADVDGRPGWLAADQGRVRAPITLPKSLAGTLMLAQAVSSGSPKAVVPADQVLLRGDSRSATLFLRTGQYLLRVETPLGHEEIRTLDVARISGLA